MKNLAKLIIFLMLFGIFTKSITAQTTKTVGSGGNYTTLKAAFDAINSGSVTGVINLQLISSTTETSTAVLYSSTNNNANYSSVSIYPTGTGNTISGNISGPIIYLNGADNVVIDGRVNAAGSTKDLTITNTNTGSSSSTIRFGNSAENNTLKYCTIKGSETNSASGIILFSTSSTGNGCDNNLIDNNNITSDAVGRPYNAIYTLGTSGHDNSGNTISNNNIFDFFRSNNYSNGIYIGSNSKDWTISGNSFYETTTINPNGANAYYVINISTSVNHLISGNYIGGSTSLCGGPAWTMNSSFAHNFYTMYINGGTSTPVTVQNNVIQNINYTSTNNNPWDGIYLASGNINVTGNTIGSTTGTGSIVVTTPNAAATATISGGVVTAINLIGGGSGFTSAPTISFSQSGSSTSAVATAIISGGVVTGYTITNGGTGYTAAPNVLFNGTNSYSTSHGIRHLSTGAVTISNNNIGSITTIGTNSYSHCFESIVISGNASTITITNNLIGSITTANSLQTISTATSSLIKQDLRGIYINASVNSSIISGNTISNLTNFYMGNSMSRLDGIYTTGGSNTIQNNIINNLSADAASVLVKGIQQSSTTAGTIQTLTGNTVYNLYNTNGSGNVTLSGIQYSGSTSTSNNVSQNFVHNLSIVSTYTNSEIDGIVLGGGVVTCANNIINLGTGITTGYKIYGIYDNNSGIISNNSNIYFNSIYIAGTVSSGNTNSTAALWNSNNGSTRNYKNNILMNLRSGGSGGVHYAIRSAGTNGLTINYNDYYVSGSGILGNISGADKTTLGLWQSATSQDGQSLNTNPLFTTAGGVLALDYMIGAVLNGTTIATITTDYSGITRGFTPKMGALESYTFTWKGNTSTDFATASNWIGGVVPLNGANIVFDASPANNCVLDQNRIVNNITNAQSTYKLVTNGFQLKINGSLIFSNGAQIDATSTSSDIVFAGNSAQNIPVGSFVSNTIDSLKINNINGLTLNGDLTIVNGIALNAGNFSIGPNTITFNGIITAMIGTVTGGNSTNMIIGGNGGSISMPAFLLNNLTINRLSGVNLYGDLNIAGTLSLTSGTLTVGSYTLTLSGQSPTRTTGNVDVSNSSANLVFANASAIVLPASFFNGNINNLTLNGLGGVTAGSDMTINGILNMAVANPSATKGLLEMTFDYSNYPGTLITHYLNSHNLIMGANATTIGIGDVTGTVKRNTIIANTPYTFGHQFTTISLTSGTMPSELAVSITIGTTPGATTPNDDIMHDGIKRTYEILPIGGSNCFVTANFHYLHSELTSSNSSYLNTESYLTTMDYDIDINNHGYPYSDEHGRANYDFTNNYIGLSSIPITYFIQIPTTHEWRTIFTLRDYSENYITWNGSTSNDWNTASNWTILHGGAGVPSDLSHVIIPDAATTSNDAVLPTGNTTINTISIENGGILIMGNNSITIQNSLSGGWEDQNPLGNDPETSKVIFTRKNTVISGYGRFYNVEIFSDASYIGDITNQTGSTMQIAGSITKTGLGTGKWYADVSGATIEYNGGDQTVLVPDGNPQYHNLIFSGTGTKTLPSSALTLHGNLKISGTASATASETINIGGNLIINADATFETGAFNHNIAGNLTNDGSFTATSGGTITMCGSSSAQFIEGASLLTTLHNLNVNNSFVSGGVSITAPTTINNTLILTSKPVYTYFDQPFTMAAGSSVSPVGGSASSFVDGPIAKEGTTAFVFPLGNGTRWARLAIGTPTSSTTFRAQYFAIADTNTSYISSTVLPVLENVSTQEYWKLDRTLGTGDATVALYWEDAAWSGINDCANLRIAHRNDVDSTWENNDNAVTTNGTCSGATSGSITTDAEVTSFSPFTFGSLSASTNTLPVELINLETKCIDNHTKLLWQTASETNNAFFEIEKMENNKDWQFIGKVDGTGNSNQVINYSFIDEKTTTHANYYRLKQVDFDGKQEYSSVISSNCIDIQEIEIGLSSNPTRDFVKISLSNLNGNMNYQLFSANGELLQNNKIESTETSVDLRNLSSSTYYLKVIDETKEVKVFKVLKY
jgi:hypothetical protein